jgi:hypothetical protein
MKIILIFLSFNTTAFGVASQPPTPVPLDLAQQECEISIGDYGTWDIGLGAGERDSRYQFPTPDDRFYVIISRYSDSLYIDVVELDTHILIARSSGHRMAREGHLSLYFPQAKLRVNCVNH